MFASNLRLYTYNLLIEYNNISKNIQIHYNYSNLVFNKETFQILGTQKINVYVLEYDFLDPIHNSLFV